MENNENEVDKAFQKALEGMEISPPDEVWNGVERDIFRRQNDSYRLTILWIKRAAMIAGIVIGLSGMVIAGYFINSSLNSPIVKTVTPSENSGKTTNKSVVAQNDSLRQDTINEQVNLLESKNNLAENMQGAAVENVRKTQSIENIEQPVTGNTKTERNLQRENIAIPFTKKNITSENQVKMLPEYEKAIAEKMAADKKTSVAKNKKPKSSKNVGKNSKNADKNNNTEDESTENLIAINEKTESKSKITSEKTQLTEKLKTKDIMLQSKNLQIPRRLNYKDYRALLPKTTLASSTKKKQKSMLPSRFSATVLYAVDFNGRKITDNVSRFGNYKQYFSQQESIKSSSSISVRINYDASPKVTLQTGFTRTQVIQKINPCWIPAVDYGHNDVRFTLFTSAGTTSVPTEVKAHRGDLLRLPEQSTQGITYTQIPFTIQYRFLSRKISLYSITGISANIVSGSKTEVKVPLPYGQKSDVTTTDLEGLKKVNIGYQLGVGMEYNIYNRWSLVVEPVFKGTAGAINKDMPVSLSTYSYTINGGVKFHF
jgi:hypothetical protein